MRRKLVCANWKMNHTLDDGTRFFNTIYEMKKPYDADIVVFPTFPLIFPLKLVAEKCHIELGAQNLSENPSGAFTGEVSGTILKSVGADWIIIGHSERRDIFGESDELISKKLKAASDAGLKIILCVGEHIETRKSGKEKEHVNNQLEKDLVSITQKEMEAISIAYEPIWAIGTGLAAKPDDAREMMSLIRSWLHDRYDSKVSAKTRILYGGSVKPENMKQFASQPDVDGALVGGASLDAVSFLGIIDGAIIDPA